jgi:hypothetical protein
MADCVYRCEHRTAAFKLRADEGGMYRLPRPLCVDCRAELSLYTLFGEPMNAALPQGDGDSG